MNYNTKIFTESDKQYLLSESKYFKEKNPEHTAILVQIDSDILKLEKQKFLVSNELLFEDFVKTLKKKIINCNLNENLLFYNVQTETCEKTMIKNFKEPISQIYLKYKDNTTDMLIIRVTRLTTFKRLKSYLGMY